MSTVRQILGDRGYTPPLWCDGELLFCQFPLKKTDTFGFVHTLDFHWKISTQSFFADLLVFDEVLGAATELPALGAHARAAGPPHALLLACIHPVMHHRNARSLVWIYDVHLLASRLSVREFDRFAEARLGEAGCGHLRAPIEARGAMDGHAPPGHRTANTRGCRTREPSAAYLRQNRRWTGELVSNLQGLSSWRDRMRLLREVVLPPPDYMLRAYGIASSLGQVLLPVLYVHRLAAGGWKVIVGRK